jgi:hypothetical protein
LGWALDPFPGHAPADALVNANLNISSINVELFGWSTGSLLFIFILLFSGSMKRTDYLMFSVIAAVLIVYSFYWFSGGPDFGARYWYLMLVPCAALTARGIRFLQATIESGSSSNALGGTRVIVAVLCLSFFAFVNFFPWRAIDKYYHYLNMRPDIRHIAKEQGFRKALVLIRGNGFPDYTSAAVYNPLDFSAGVPVYAWDRGAKVREELFAAFPDRPIWILNGPSITNRGYEISEGPIHSTGVPKTAETNPKTLH